MGTRSPSQSLPRDQLCWSTPAYISELERSVLMELLWSSMKAGKMIRSYVRSADTRSLLEARDGRELIQSILGAMYGTCSSVIFFFFAFMQTLIHSQIIDICSDWVICMTISVLTISSSAMKVHLHTHLSKWLITRQAFDGK